MKTLQTSNINLLTKFSLLNLWLEILEYETPGMRNPPSKDIPKWREPIKGKTPEVKVDPIVELQERIKALEIALGINIPTWGNNKEIAETINNIPEKIPFTKPDKTIWRAI